MLPVEFFYAVLVLGVSVTNGHNSIFEVMVIFISCFAAWEISAESYVLKREKKRYILFYQGVSHIPRILFWTITVTLVLVGWVVALR